MRTLVGIGAIVVLGCSTLPPAPDGWRVMPEGSSLPGDCKRDGFAVVDHEGELRIATTLGEIVGIDLRGGSPRPQGEGWLVLVPSSRFPGRIFESKARGQAPEQTGETGAVAALVEPDGLLLAYNDCEMRGPHVESSIVRFEPATTTTVAGPWPICIQAMARDADGQIWLLANLHPHWEVDVYHVLFRLNASGKVLHHEYTLDVQPELAVDDSGGITHMEIVDEMIWLSGVERPVIRLRREGERWVQESVVPSDCRSR
jgi:hypothetical protein